MPGAKTSAVMGIQGMELFAIGVVIILFVAVLKQFGILEPMSLEDGECKHPSNLVSSICYLVYLLVFSWGAFFIM